MISENRVMGRVRILWGTGTGPTALASYDAALVGANVHDYNLLRVSSVLPVATTVDPVGTAPDLGPIGGTLTVVEARETSRVVGHGAVDGSSGPGSDPVDRAPVAGNRPDRDIACAGLGWAQAENGRGIVYEGTGTDPEAVRKRIERGLRAGSGLRDFAPARFDRVLVTTDGRSTRIERGAETLASTPVRARDPHDESDASDTSGADGGEPEYVAAVVLAAYGESDPVS